MWVKLRTEFVTRVGGRIEVYRVGDVIELSDDHAKRMIAKERAVKVAKPRTPKPVGSEVHK